MTILVLANFLLASLMTGLIWFVQVVHYPLMSAVDERAWAAYHNAHARRTTYIVAPLMLLEATAAGLWVWQAPGGFSWAAAGLLCVVWISTFLIQVPIHGQLAHGKSSRSIELLVQTNWLRTIGWTARAGVCIASAIGG